MVGTTVKGERMTSMEEFGPVAVDYFHGRSVESVEGEGDVSEGHLWAIKFEGGGYILNYDPTYPPPPNEIVGLALTLTTLGTSPTTGTKLYFGDRLNPRKMMVNLNPLEYAIQDDTYTQGKVVFAQRSNANMPPDALAVEEADEA